MGFSVLWCHLGYFCVNLSTQVVKAQWELNLNLRMIPAVSPVFQLGWIEQLRRRSCCCGKGERFADPAFGSPSSKSWHS